MDITIYRRHSDQCPEKQDRYAPRCGCPLSFQFNWKQASTTLNGNKLKRGQNKWAANTRSWSEAQTNSKKLEKDLENLLQGATTSVEMVPGGGFSFTGFAHPSFDVSCTFLRLFDLRKTLLRPF
jgi:hypothetical protein